MVSDSPAAQTEVHEVSESTRRETRIESFGRWLRTGMGFASAAVSLTVGILTLVFLVRPALQPGNEPVILRAELSNAAIETTITYGEYLNRSGRGTEGVNQQALETPGVVVSFDLSIDGFAGEAVSLRYSVLDSQAYSPVYESWLVDQPGWPVSVFIAEAASDKMNSEIWVAEPQASGTYVVRLQLFDPDDVRLASTDSPPFEVA